MVLCPGMQPIPMRVAQQCSSYADQLLSCGRKLYEQYFKRSAILTQNREADASSGAYQARATKRRSDCSAWLPPEQAPSTGAG
ncbi:unnamed protein product [Chondrus crispus]|uniref:Uncharacterized protein n=1 Tax=Chondrus crispus TaxID=2769 RepID=R7Q3P1_CHOCR|nr:unnamed protein product [Chondrus crispus]CDF32639.1 unnamed protein product [Chondrus crispus]|eukprot:XP_005712410.1 unnamed protein product [Chondrus crispus]